MNAIATFRKCTLSDEALIKKIDRAIDRMYEEGEIPMRHIPARPNDDLDIMIGELLLRYREIIMLKKS